MALYYYSGLRSNGKRASGFVAGHTEDEAIYNIERMAIRDFKFKRAFQSLGGLEYVVFKDISKNSISKRSEAYFFEQLSFLLKAGLTTFEAVDVLSQSSNVEIAKLCVRLRPSIASGMSIDDAMKKSGLFSFDTIAKIEAGRKSNKITGTLERLAKSLKDSIELRGKIISSLTYPCFMVVMLIAVLIIMLAFIIPSIGKTVLELGGEMPKLTMVVMSISDFVVKYGLFILIGIILLVIGHIYLLKNVKQYKLWCDTLLFKLPVFGKIILKISLQSLSSAISQLIDSGVSTPNALKIASRTTSNTKLKNAVKSTADFVAKEGYDLYSAMSAVRFFPADYVQMVMIGTKSGNVCGLLDSISDQYAYEVQESLKRITAMIEPVAILLTALIGGVCVISMYVPMFSVFQAI